MNRLYVLVIILILLMVGGRLVGYHRWVKAELCIDCEVAGMVRLNQMARIAWDKVSFDWRGVPVVCPNTVQGCERISSLQAGDGIAFGGMSTGDGVKIYEIKRVEIIKPLPILSWWWWVRLATKIQGQVVETYQSNLGEPYGGLLSGIVLGVQSTMPADFYQALVKTGTLHVVAASGYNINVVAGVLIALLVWWLPRRRAVVLAIGGVAGYVLLAGGNPAVVRAGIMGGITFLSQALGKETTAHYSLFLAAAVMLIFAPWLLTSVSFQLSVAATAGILIGAPRLVHQVSRSKVHKNRSNPIRQSLIKDFSTTVAATLATLPITLVVFGRVSWIAPVVNVLVLWLVPPIMGLGAVVALTGFISPRLAQVAAVLTYPLLKVFVGVVEWFAELSGVMLELEGVSWWFAWGWWLILVGIWKSRKGVGT